MTVEQDLKRFEKAKTRKEQWKSEYSDAYRYVTPQRDTFYFHSEGSRRTQYKYDSTARKSLRLFVSRIMGAMFPSWDTWAYLTSGSDVPEDKREEVDQLLEESTEIIFNYINHSNFESQASITMLDIAYGTGCMLVEEGDSDRLLVHKNIPLAELSIEEGPYCTIETVFRHYDVKARNIQRHWPKAKIPDDLQKVINDQPDADVKIVAGSIYEPKDKVYRQTIIWEKAKTEIFTWNEKSNPYIVPRWEVNPGEIYGEGPIMEVLDDIKTLNKATEFTLRAAALAVSGVYTAVNDGVINPYSIKIRPNSIIPVASNRNDNPTLRPLEPAGRMDLSEIVREELRANIKEALFADVLPDIQDGVRTATEWNIRLQEMLKNSGAQLARLQGEFGEKYLIRAIDILQRNGKLPELSVDGREITLTFTSPLAKQRKMDELSGLENYMMIMGNLEQFAPGLMAMSTKLEEVPRYVSDIIGGIGELVRTDAEMKQTAETVMQAGQQMALGGGEMEGEPPIE